ncbi:MAG: hypothetical protein HKN57_01395 [Xanthomonadales bacterium]|nr:hypothetical protein [Xanthomonadales bacterium]
MKRHRSAGARKIAPAALVLFSLIILGWAGLRANAAWNFFAAQSITERMHEADAFTQAGIVDAQSYLDRALSGFPNNPDYLDLAGHLQELRANQAGVVGSEREALLESAAANYRASLIQRPRWPYGWARLLAVKDQLGQIDAEFKTAMNRAAQTGPWEPRVQLQIIRSGMRYWDRLSRPERELLREKTADGLKMRPREVFQLARRFSRPDLVCLDGVDQPQIERWCTGVMPGWNS